MAVEFALLLFDEASGATVANYGDGADATISSTGTASYTRNANADPQLSYAEFTQTPPGGGNPVTYLDMSSITMATTAAAINMHFAFSVSAYDTSGSQRGYLYMPGKAVTYGGIELRVVAPSSGGDYDIFVEFRPLDGTPEDSEYTLTGLAFGTKYILGASISTAGVLKLKLNSNAVQTVNGSAWGSDTLAADLGWIGRGDFANYYGVQAKLYWLYLERGGTAWDDTALAGYNSDPTTLDGWPVVTSFGPHLHQSAPVVLAH